MVTSFCEPELRGLDAMSRPQLLEAVKEHWECLPVDLQERVGDQATHRLRLYVLAARLIHALRQQSRRRF
jgi:hypothetical protein